MKIIFSLLFILFGNLVIAQSILVIKNAKEVTNISKQVSILEDVENKLSIKDMLKGELQSKFTFNVNENVSLSNKTSSTWIKFSLQNTSEKELFLQIEDFSIPNFEIYIPTGIPDSFRVKQFGSSLPYFSKEVITNFYLVSLVEAKDSLVNTFYIHFNHKSARNISLKISEAKNFFEENHERDIFYGIFIGVMSIMALYNFFVYLTVKDITYLYYSCHIVTTSLSILVFTGYGFNLFWYNYPQINELIMPFTVGTPLIFLIIFSISFLNTAKYAPLAQKGLYVFIAFFIVNTIYSTFNQTTGLGTSRLIVLILCLCLFSLALYVYIKGNKAARFYLLANGFYLLGVVTILLASMRILPRNLLTTNSYQIGSMLEVLFFSFALADRIRSLTKEQEKAQKENLRLVEEQKDMLEAKVKERTIEIEEKNAEIVSQNEELQQQHEELIVINDNLEIKNKLIESQKVTIETTFSELKTTSDRLHKSIQYAYNIQQIILPKKGKLDSFFSEHFSIYLPKDVVSGDFYWFTKLTDTQAIFILADCTGHGVPGAFMSMIGNTLLHEITKTKGISSPAEILLNLHHGIRNVLKQEESQNSDGMDISVCLFEKNVSQKTYKVTFAGAKGSIFYSKDTQIIQLFGDRITIGGYSRNNLEFTNQTFILQADDVIYFTSDGYIDQHDVGRKRFSSVKFKELLSSICQLPISEQEKVILSALKEHQKEEEQRDDISVVGIKL